MTQTLRQTDEICSILGRPKKGHDYLMDTRGETVRTRKNRMMLAVFACLMGT